MNTHTQNSNARAAIGTQVSAIARKHSMSVADFLKALNDKDIGYDAKEQRLIYACEGLAVPEGAPEPIAADAGGSVAPGDADPTDLSLAFKLHSRPGAAKKLLLDFTGHSATGTVWNSQWARAEIATPAYDVDGNPAAFSDVERANIIAIWRAVAEDYAAFDVDVTTEETDPLTGAPLALSGSGARAVIGGSSYDWYGAGAGGVAYVGTFGARFLRLAERAHSSTPFFLLLAAACFGG